MKKRGIAKGGDGTKKPWHRRRRVIFRPRAEPTHPSLGFRRAGSTSFLRSEGCADRPERPWIAGFSLRRRAAAGDGVTSAPTRACGRHTRSGFGLPRQWRQQNRAVRPACAVAIAIRQAAPALAIKTLAKQCGMCDNFATGWRLHLGKPPWSGEEAAAEMGQMRTKLAHHRT